MTPIVLRNKLSGLISKLIADVGTTNLFLLFLLTVITFYPLLFVGFTTHDDIALASSGISWADALFLSQSQGRFNFFWGYYLGEIPYVIDHRAWYLSAKIGAFILVLSGLWYAIYQLFRSGWMVLAALSFFLAFIQNGWDHNALNSYPVVFNCYAALFLFSLGLFSKAINQNNIGLAICSGVLYFFALGVELFVLFFPYYVVVLLSKDFLGGHILSRFIAGKNYLLAVALPLILYLVMYLVWRLIYPSTYDGNSAFSFDFLAAIKVIVTYSLNAFPLETLNYIFAPHRIYGIANATDLRIILAQIDLADIIKPVVAGFLFTRLMTTPIFIVPRVRTLYLAAILAFVGIFIPNLLLGFTERHQGWQAGGVTSYLYTYYSFISAAVFGALILSIINNRSRLWPPKFRLIFIMIAAIIIMVITFFVEEKNQIIAFDQKLSHRKFQLMDEVIKSSAFKEIPDGSTIVAPTLSVHRRGIAQAEGNDWSSYIKHKTGKNIRFDDVRCDNVKMCYTLVFRQEISDNQFIVLAKIKNIVTLVSSELTIFSMPGHPGSVLFGSFEPSMISPKIEINSVPLANVGTRLFSGVLPPVSDDAIVQTARLTSTVDMIPEKLTISNYNVEPKLRPLSAELNDGIDFKKPGYPYFIAEVTGMSGYEPTHRWSDANVDPTVRFRFKKPLPTKFVLEISGFAYGPNIGEPFKVKIGKVDKVIVMVNGIYNIEFETDSLADTIEIIPPNPTSPNEVDSKNRDKRKLGIAFIALKIKDESGELAIN
jgi:hypothetical protein